MLREITLEIGDVSKRPITLTTVLDDFAVGYIQIFINKLYAANVFDTALKHPQIQITQQSEHKYVLNILTNPEAGYEPLHKPSDSLDEILCYLFTELGKILRYPKASNLDPTEIVNWVDQILPRDQKGRDFLCAIIRKVEHTNPHLNASNMEYLHAALQYLNPGNMTRPKTISETSKVPRKQSFVEQTQSKIVKKHIKLLERTLKPMQNIRGSIRRLSRSESIPREQVYANERRTVYKHTSKNGKTYYTLKDSRDVDAKEVVLPENAVHGEVFVENKHFQIRENIKTGKNEISFFARPKEISEAHVFIDQIFSQQGNKSHIKYVQNGIEHVLTPKPGEYSTWVEKIVGAKHQLIQEYPEQAAMRCFIQTNAVQHAVLFACKQTKNGTITIALAKDPWQTTARSSADLLMLDISTADPVGKGLMELIKSGNIPQVSTVKSGLKLLTKPASRFKMFRRH